MQIIRHRKQHKALPIIIFVAIVFIFSYAAVLVVRADGLHKRDQAWYGEYDSMPSKQDDLFPYNSKTATISAVSMDILYGTSRELVAYFGEVPYAQTYSGKDRTDQFSGYFALEGTSSEDDTNPPNNATKEDYWGYIQGQAQTLESLEKVNDNGVVSLRIYALSHCTGEWGFYFNNLFYRFSQFLTRIGHLLVELLISVKNISVNKVLELLQLDSVAEFMTKSFIGYDIGGQTFWLSPFTGFCIIMGLVALVSYTVSYLKGGSKNKGLGTLIWYYLLGVIIIGICLLNKVTDVGSIASDLVGNSVYTVAASMKADNSTAWKISITDPEHSSQIIQLQELSIINKTYVDIQICTQFGVDSILDLNANTLGISVQDGSAEQILYGLEGTEHAFYYQFGGNIGYYYWFANTSAKQHTNANKTYPELQESSTERKLESMITYLQHIYNKNYDAGGELSQTSNARIASMVRSLSSPNGWAGGLKLIFFSVILILLAVCLWKYCLLLMLSKVEMFFAVLGLSVAGPLIITNNDKLVNTGKNILGMIYVCFIEIIIYSLVFDLVLFFVAAILQNTEFLSFILAIVVLIMLMIFNPYLQKKIREILSSFESRHAPMLKQGKQAVRNYTQNKMRDVENRWNQGGKLVGYDEKGNEIRESHKGDRISKLLAHANNELFADGTNHKGFFKIRHDTNEERSRAVNDADRRKQMAAEAAVKECEEKIEETAEERNKRIQSQADQETNATYQRYEKNGKEVIKFNEDKLTTDEVKTKKAVDQARVEYERLANSKDYQSLVSAYLSHLKPDGSVAYDETFTKEDEARLHEIEQMISQKNQDVSNKEKALLAEIQKNRTLAMLEKVSGMEGDAFWKSTKFSPTELEELKKCTPEELQKRIKMHLLSDAQYQHRDEYKALLEKNVETAAVVTDKFKKTRIGSNESKVNVEAAKAEARAVYKLHQLERGMLVEKNDKQIDEKVSGMVETLAATAEKNWQLQEQAKTGQQVVDGASKIQGSTRKETREMRQKERERGYNMQNQAHDAYKEARKENREVQKIVKSDGGNKSSLADQIKSSVAREFGKETPEKVMSASMWAAVEVEKNRVANAPKPVAPKPMPIPQAQPSSAQSPAPSTGTPLQQNIRNTVQQQPAPAPTKSSPMPTSKPMPSAQPQQQAQPVAQPQPMSQTQQKASPMAQQPKVAPQPTVQQPVPQQVTQTPIPSQQQPPQYLGDQVHGEGTRELLREAKTAGPIRSSSIFHPSDTTKKEKTTKKDKDSKPKVKLSDLRKNIAETVRQSEDPVKSREQAELDRDKEIRRKLDE